MTENTDVAERELVRRLAEFIHDAGRVFVNRGNPPNYGAARALLAAGVINRDALAALAGAAS